MNNTVTVEKPLRRNLKLASALLCVFSLCFIAILVSVAQIGKLNLNGQVTNVTGMLTGVFEEESNALTLDNDKYFNVVWGDDEEVNFEDYKGKEITIVTSQKTFGISNPWVLGLVVDGQTIVDYNKTIQSKTAENNELKTFFIAVTAVVCVATCAVMIWRFNTPPLVERVLYHEFAEFACNRQPPCPERKKMLWYVCGFIIGLVALAIPLLALDANAETFADMSPVGLAFAIGWIVYAVLGIVVTVILRIWSDNREKKFYDENLPFDFSDISHVTMRKSVKEKMQQELRKAYDDYPDLYPDGGNGYEVLFQDGLVKVQTENIESSGSFERVFTPSAEEVFGTTDGDADTAATSNELWKKPRYKTVMTLTYGEMNLEAVAHYRRCSRPMTIIIKSRLTKNSDFPEEFEHDLHFVLDSNLLNTLRKYNVKVENLDYLLDNKAQLMKENCTLRKIREQKK